MSLPTVAIVGRPNVGKSTLFNRLVGKRVALVDDRPGVTRDRREGEGHLLGLEFRVMDTAGFEEVDPASLPGRMRQQTEAAVREADVALFVIDGREGLTPLDEEIARWLRHENTPVIVAANKSEGNAGEAGRIEAFALGFGEPFALSAEHGEGLVDLFEALRPHIEPDGEAQVEEERGDDEDYVGPLKLAIVGRPNAGKSTLVNKMLDEDRMITGPEAGITRDSISIDWQWTDKDGVTHPVRLIDTAGLRKRAKVDDKLERLSAHDTKRAIDFAEVVVLLLDGTRGLEAQDLRIADQVLQEGRALGHRAQQMGRRRTCLVAVQRGQGGAARRAQPAQGRALADRVGDDRQGHRPVDRRGAGSARELVAPGRDGRAQPLVRQGGRDQSAPRAGRQEDQAALHHPDQDAPAELRHFRQPGRPIAGQLSPLSAQFDAPRPCSLVRCRFA